MRHEDLGSTTPTRRSAPLLVPTETRVLGDRYRLRRLLGRGGMSDVFLADDLLLERAVAIKILNSSLCEDPIGLERFRREAMTLATVRSPHIVGIYDIGRECEGACVFLVMQHFEGKTLEQEVARTGPMPVLRTEKIIMQLLDGIAEMHSHDLIHRDIKPSNVLIDSNDHVVLLDLGIVHDARRAKLTETGMLAGTPGYFPPERQTSGDSEFTADIYQVGMLLVFLMTGVSLARRRSDVEALLASIPQPIQTVTRRALAPDPGDRFPSAAIMKASIAHRLERPSGHEPGSLIPRGRTPRSEFRPIAVPPVPREESTAVLADEEVSMAADDGPGETRTAQNAPTVRMHPLRDVCELDGLTSAPTRRRVKREELELRPIVPRGKILIVDEDSALCSTLQKLLETAHDVLAVNSGRHALANIQAGTQHDIILCGLTTPSEFHEALLSRWPKQADAVIFLTPPVATSSSQRSITRLNNPRLIKPLEISRLHQLITNRLVSSPQG